MSFLVGLTQPAISVFWNSKKNKSPFFGVERIVGRGSLSSRLLYSLEFIQKEYRNWFNKRGLELQ